MGVGLPARSIGDGGSDGFNASAGMRLGYAHLEPHAFVMAGELGLDHDRLRKLCREWHLQVHVAGPW